MTDLTERQTSILRAVIEEYIKAAEPVGSQKIEKRYEFGVSPATIRNEMAKLTEAGFLKQPHSSAGRVPTPQAFKFYVDQLLEEKELSVAEEVAAKEKVWDARFNFNQLMREATRALAEKTHSLAVAATKEGDLYHSGYANILEMPEFFDIDITRTVLSIIDQVDKIQSLFEKSYQEGPVHLLLGEELGYDYLEPCSLIFTQFEAGDKHRGCLGVIGANRCDYAVVIPIVRYFGSLVEELARNL